MSNTSQQIGYLINIGVTTCRLFKVNEDESLKEDSVISYRLSPEEDEYFNEIISNIQNIVKNFPDNFLVKVIVDTKFTGLFDSETQLKEFIRLFYIKTNLYFNILTQKQTEKNLFKLFGKITDTAIINIGRNYVDIMIIRDGNIDSVSLKYSLKNVEAIIKTKKMKEILEEGDINKIKDQIKRSIKKELVSITVTNAIIIKDELSFMQEFNYPLQKESKPLIDEHEFVIDFETYKCTNRKKLFCIDFKTDLKNRKFEDTKQKRLYGFKQGHLLLETIFEIISVKKIIPSNLLNIHGNINSYIYNVVLSGSTKEKHKGYFFEAAEFIRNLGATITSPKFTSENKLLPITTETDYAHLKAIDDCDILFICNKDGYIGETTACEIYYASALRKTIVFWAEPDKSDRLYCIPHEHWSNIKIVRVNKNV